MKKATSKRRTATQKADSRKQPDTLNKTGRTQKTPAGERNDPQSRAQIDDAYSSKARTDKTPKTELERMRHESAEMDPSASDDEISQEIDDDQRSARPSEGFHPPSVETRRERATHEKGWIEGRAMLNHIPPAKHPGDPGSAPRVMQRRKVFERGNRYPLTHAKG